MSVYSATIPLLANTIGSDVSLIGANFAFLAEAIAQEHGWDADDATAMVHSGLASLATGLLSARPSTGTNQQFYYATDVPKLYYGTGDGGAWNEISITSAGPAHATSHAPGGSDDIFTTSKLKIDSSTGYVGVGTTSPASKLEVYNDTFTDFRDGTGNIYLGRSTSAKSGGIKIEGKISHTAYVGCTGGTDALSLGHDGGTYAVDAITILTSGLVGVGTTSPVTKLDVDGSITQHELSADPADPAEGSFVTWMSDGTGSGDDGDIMMKITAGGSTKTVTLVDFSEA